MLTSHSESVEGPLLKTKSESLVRLCTTWDLSVIRHLRPSDMSSRMASTKRDKAGLSVATSRSQANKNHDLLHKIICSEEWTGNRLAVAESRSAGNAPFAAN